MLPDVGLRGAGVHLAKTDRRGFLGLVAGAALCPQGNAFARETLQQVSLMKPGQFTWHPERQRTGPVAVIVSINEQRVHVYRNGVRIGVSTCSTGKPGHETPTGIFVILEKDKDHKSSTYDDAPMPNMNRLTWSGIALHAGNLPGYPASHGCIRLPLGFSELLFGVTHLGTPVIIASESASPWELAHPGLILGGYAGVEMQGMVATLKSKERPSDWTDFSKQPILSVVASSADRRIILVENGATVGEGPLVVQGSSPLGSHVFIYQGLNTQNSSLNWLAITETDDSDSRYSQEAQVISRISSDPPFIARMGDRLHPGAMLVLTDLPLTPDRQSGTDFVIMN